MNKKRKEKKSKKIKSCIENFVCSPGKIDGRYTGVTTKRKTYGIKCPECPFVASQLPKHLTVKHQYVISEMKFKESEIRIFYLWSQKDKHGTPKPLPFKICKIWHARLRTHLKNLHKFSSDEITRRKNASLKMYETNIFIMNGLRSSNLMSYEFQIFMMPN